MEKIKILLIDHEEDFIKNFSGRIKSRILELDLAVNGEQALELVVNVKPDVIILNPRTPDIDGMELLWDIKTAFPDIQVIILSRNCSIQNRMEALVAGAYRLFEEPVDIDDLINTIIQAYKEKSINNYIKL
jgi:DNA-binding NtrC family response regulator